MFMDQTTEMNLYMSVHLALNKKFLLSPISLNEANRKSGHTLELLI